MSSPEESVPVPFKPMRLQRYLAQCGLGSRRDCEELITAGRIDVDGKTANQLGTTVDPATQTITLDGERLKLERKKYFMLNKPSGFLCTADDPAGRRVVLDLFPQEGPRLFTVGRLDENTTGLLIVTNDGDLAQKLAHPRYRIFRLYRAQVAGQPKPEVFEQLRKGLFFTEGKFRMQGVKPIKKQKDSVWVEITMTEGQNREIRRLFARVGHKVMKLERIGYGPLRLGKLSQGEYRDLTRDELAELHGVLDRNQKGEASTGDIDRPQRPASGKPTRTDRLTFGTGERPQRTRPGTQRSTGSRTTSRPDAGEQPAGKKWPAKGAKRPTSGRPTEQRSERPSRPAGAKSRPPGKRPPKGKGRGRD